MKPVPWVTVSIAVTATILSQFPLDAGMVFDRGEVLSSSPWQLFTGHLVHSGPAHLFWNLFAGVVIGSMLEARSRGLLLCATLIGLVAVNGLLLSPLSPLQFYCGLSGMLNTWLFVLLWQLWRDSGSGLIVGLSLLCLVKVLLELMTGSALLTSSEWQSYPPAHLAGMLGAMAYVSISLFVSRKSTGCQSWRNEIRRLEPWTV